jgi:hypothetical protein
MRDSTTPVQPKRAKAKAVCSASFEGAVMPVEVKNDGGRRERIEVMGEPG